jgi:erythromycin esterase-like protein
MSRHSDSQTVETIQRAAHALTGLATDYDPLLDIIGDARFVLLGEASHGTQEFYQARAGITKRLIEEKGFVAVAIEADWPDAYRVNCFVRGAHDEESEGVASAADAVGALSGFKKFPQWMWRNTSVLSFINWLHRHNQSAATSTQQCGFYGIDLYSLSASMEEVIRYLDEVDPEAAKRARERYSCFDHFAHDSQAYGYATNYGGAQPCEDAAIQQLLELQRRATELARADGFMAEDKHFYAEQNARLVKNAEEYYRSMFRGRASSWNLRDTHMAETLDALTEHLGREGDPAKVVVWAHNSHLGDARATEMGRGGELNVGQLVRQKYGSESVLVGFSTYSGEVTAAADWDQPGERKRVRPGLEGSYEHLFHEASTRLKSSNFLLNLRDGSEAAEVLREERLERAIGVLYRPETERWSHYFHASLPEQFDAALHFDHTHAVEPLERNVRWEQGEAIPSSVETLQGDAPETFPSSV